MEQPLEEHQFATAGRGSIITSVEIVLRFIDAINDHSVDAILGLMTGNHKFVDSLGNTIEGRANMRKAWKGYFAMVPDYSIAVSQVMEFNGTVGVFGYAKGSYSFDGTINTKNRWETPAAWRAVVTGGAVSEWQVYADNEPIRQIMRADEREQNA